MFLKLVTIDLLLPNCSSLKEKRYVLSSIKTRLRRKCNISVSEVDFQDKWQRSRLAVAAVGVDRTIVDQGCSQAFKLIEDDFRIVILDYVEEYR
jgi:uncharacterized protein YlxP (DUF503 family)